jgi:hypothetical protein
VSYILLQVQNQILPEYCLLIYKILTIVECVVSLAVLVVVYVQVSKAPIVASRIVLGVAFAASGDDAGVERPFPKYRPSPI